MLKYDTEKRKTFLASFESKGKPLEAIHALFDTLVEQAKTDETKRGCFLVNTALAIQQHDDEITHLVSAAVEDLRMFFVRLLQHGVVRGEIPKEKNIDSLAAGLVGLLFGIRVLSRGAVDEKTLRQMSDQALALLT